MNTSLKNTFYKRFSLILIGSVIVISALVIRGERLLLTEDLKDKGESIAGILSSVTLDAILSHDYATMERYAADVVEEKFVNGIGVIRSDGEVLVGSLLHASSNTLLIEHPIKLGGEEFGMVQIGFSTDRIDSITWRIVFAACGLIIVLHVLGLVLTNIVLQKTVLKPLTRMHAAIQTIAGGNFSKQFDPAGPREFVDIGAAFNTMGTKLQRSFADIEKSHQALDLEKKKLAAIVASMADGLFVTDNNEVIISYNESASRITGYTKQEALGQKCEDLFRTCLCSDACALRHAGETLENIETSLITKDDRRLDVAVSSAILSDRDGNRIGGVQSFRDITDEKKRHDLYCRTEKLAALGQLAAGIAHEINNPLGNIIGYAKMIKPEAAPEKNSQRVEVIVEQARKCSEIVKGLLDYSRASVSEPGYLDLAETVRRVVEVLQLQIHKKKINLSLDLQKLPSLLADERKMEQIVMNLSLNAIQAVEHGGSISIATWREKDMVRLAVSDNGPGVPQELRCRIFDPFFTTKPVGEGTGLGLAICAGLIDELDGLIEIDDKAAGASFVVSLPLPTDRKEEVDV